MITWFIIITLLSMGVIGFVVISFSRELWDYTRVLPESKLVTGVTGNIARARDNNTIFLIDKNTRCLNLSRGCEKVSQNAFTDIADTVRAIAAADKSRPIKLVVSVDGGQVLNTYTILRRLRLHPAGFVAYCNDAMSAGAFITVCADEIVMTPLSRLYKMDTVVGGVEIQHYVSYEPQLRALAAVQVARMNETTAVTSEAQPSFYFDTYVKLDNALSAFETDVRVLAQAMPRWDQLKEQVLKHLFYGGTRHYHSFSYSELKEMGLPVREASAEEEELYFGYFQTN